MKKLLALFLLTLLCASGFAQTVTLTFTGRDVNNCYCQLDRVVITNMTRSWQETINWPDTILTIQAGTGIEDYAAGDVFALSQNNPNPFNGTTAVNLAVVETGDVYFEIADVNGRIVETQNFASLQAGNHRFRIQVSAVGIYFMTARQRGQSSTIKMVSNGNGVDNDIQYIGSDETQSRVSQQTKGGTKGATDNPFSFGDQMEYVGYATFNGTDVESQRIQQMQGASQTFTLQFNAVQAQLPTVTTFVVTDIMPTSATCGGSVTADGGAAVIDRGICYNTTGMPTISDSCVHSGTGTGTFSQNLTGLTASTTYYVRAYAINSVGVAYGDTVTFTTSAFACGVSTLTDVDGNVYNTVQIGNQCWMRENLRTTLYADGTSISLGSSTSTTTAYLYCPNNDTSNVPIYGYLYNWPAVKHNSSSSSANPSGVQGICPNGWHIPSDAEWTQLTSYVSSQSQYVCGSDNRYIAKALASTTGWNSSSVSSAVGNDPSTNNATGFSAVPAGSYYGSYDSFGDGAYFWSVTQSDGYSACYSYLVYNYARMGSYYGSKYNGFSVRCLRD